MSAVWAELQKLNYNTRTEDITKTTKGAWSVPYVLFCNPNAVRCLQTWFFCSRKVQHFTAFYGN